MSVARHRHKRAACVSPPLAPFQHRRRMQKGVALCIKSSIAPPGDFVERSPCGTILHPAFCNLTQASLTFLSIAATFNTLLTYFILTYIRIRYRHLGTMKTQLPLPPPPNVRRQKLVLAGIRALQLVFTVSIVTILLLLLVAPDAQVASTVILAFVSRPPAATHSHIF